MSIVARICNCMLDEDRIVARMFGAVGAGGVVVGCGAMTAMLPGAAASVLGGLGLGSSSVVGRAVASASKPLFVLSAVLLIVAGLACSWLTALTAGCGSLLLYLSMFVLLDDEMNSSSMAGMSGMSAGRANVPLFWAGSVVVLGNACLVGLDGAVQVSMASGGFVRVV